MKPEEPGFVLLFLEATIKMPETLKRFAAVFAEWAGPECKIVTIEFQIEDEEDAWDVAEDLAVLEERELIYLARVLKQSEQYGRCEDRA